MHQMIKKILEAENLYVSYAITSDTQRGTTKWIETLEIEEKMEGILEIKGMME